MGKETKINEEKRAEKLGDEELTDFQKQVAAAVNKWWQKREALKISGKGHELPTIGHYLDQLGLGQPQSPQTPKEK